MLCPQFLTSFAFPATSHTYTPSAGQFPILVLVPGVWGTHSCLRAFAHVISFIEKGLFADCAWLPPYISGCMFPSPHLHAIFYHKYFCPWHLLSKITLIYIYLFSVCLCIKDVSSVKVLWKQSLGLSWFTTMSIKVYWVNEWIINLLDISVYGITHLPPLFLISPWPILWL